MAEKTAVVTGASSGIGAATVRRLRRDGWDVVGVARRTDRLEALAAETGAASFTADITDQEQVTALRDYLADRGPIHVLVNNAGGAIGRESIESGSTDDWLAMFQSNVIGTKQVTSALLPLLRAGVSAAQAADPARLHTASIVMVTSVAGHEAYQGGGGYNAAKFGEAALTRVLRLELTGEPIRVIDIAPGIVATEEFSLVRFRGDVAAAQAVYDNFPHPLVADDIADAIAYTVNAPAHVNIDQLIIQPVAQAAPYRVVYGDLQVKED